VRREGLAAPSALVGAIVAFVPAAGSSVVTGEAVALDLRPAALPSRVLAGLLDALLQLAVLVVLGGVAGAVGIGASQAAGAALGLLVTVGVLLGYPVAFETLLRGRTPGKAAMGLRVVRDDGGPVGFRQSLVRGLAGGFLERPGITFFVAGVVSSLLNPQGKRLGDLLAGTVVRQERVAVRGGQVAVMPPPLAGWAAGADLSGLGDDLALSARQFLARAGQLTGTAREQLGSQLVTAVSDAVRPPPPPGTPGWAVLAAVVAERRRREERRLAAVAGPTAGHLGSASPPAAALPAGAPAAAAPPAAAPPAGAPPAGAPPSDPSPSFKPAGAGPARSATTPGGFAPPA